MKKIGLLCLALVLALGALGVGFAAWSETLIINGTVNTGTVDAKFTKAVSNDAGTQLDPDVQGTWALDGAGDLVWTGTRYDKDVASTSVSGEGTKTLTITIDNAYPCYWGSVGFTIDNMGTIPLKVDTVVIEKTGPAGDPDANGLTVVPTGALIDTLHTLIEPMGDPGDEVVGDIHFHLDDTAVENAIYEVTVTITVTQWNEVP